MSNVKVASKLAALLAQAGVDDCEFLQLFKRGGVTINTILKNRGEEETRRKIQQRERCMGISGRKLGLNK